MVGDEVNTFFDGWLEFGNGFCELDLFKSVDFAEAKVLLNTDLTELDLARLSDATALQTIVNNAFSGTPLEGQHRVGCITPTRCFDLN